MDHAQSELLDARHSCSDVCRASAVRAEQRQTLPVPPMNPSPYPIEEFYQNTQLRGLAFSPTAENPRLLRSTGIWNAYAIPVTGGPLQPLTNSRQNSVFTISYFPTDERFLYSSDEGGNELAHIYVQA